MPILAINFIGTFGFSLVVPFLVVLVERYGGNAVVYGIVGAIYPAFQLVGAPILGKWSDSIGRKPVLLLSQLGTLFSWLVFAGALLLPVTGLLEVKSGLFAGVVVTVPLLVIMIARALDGVTGGNVSVANAYLADVTTGKDRSSSYGLMSVSSNLGFILGPAIAGVLGGSIYGEMLPVLAAVAISLAASAMVAFWLPESRKNLATLQRRAKAGKASDKIQDEGKANLSFAQTLTLPGIPFLLFSYFVVFLAFNVFYTAFPVHALGALGWSVTEMGIYFSFLSLLMAFTNGPVLSRVSKKVSEPTLVVVGALILSSNFAAVAIGGPVLIYLAAVAFALGNGLMWPSLLSILSKTASEKNQGMVQGVAASGGSLASIVGLIGGGFLYQMFGAGAFWFSAGLALFVGVVCVRLTGVMGKKQG